MDDRRRTLLFWLAGFDDKLDAIDDFTDALDDNVPMYSSSCDLSTV